MITNYYDEIPFCCNLNKFSKENPDECKDNAKLINTLREASFTKLKTLPTGIVANQIYFHDKEQTIAEIAGLVEADFRALYITDLKRHPIKIAYHCIFDDDDEPKYFTYEITDGKIINKNEITETEADEIRNSLSNKPINKVIV